MSIKDESRAAAGRLLDYLASEYDGSGSSRTAPSNIQYYYKLPAVFAYGGRRELACRTLEQFAGRFMKDGRFDLSTDPIARPWTPYLSGWLAWGAGALGRFDLARKVMNTALTFRHEGSGGYQFPGPDGTPLLDVERTGAALMGCVWSGDVAEGRAAAGFLRLALERQPSPADEFHAYLGLDGRVVPDRSDRNAFFSLTDPFARPALFATGIAGLVWLARSTDDCQFIDLASAYMRVVQAHDSDPAALLLATKLGWSALMLAAHRDEAELSDLARRCAKNLIRRQKSDGSIDFDHLPDVPKPIDKLWLIGWGCDCALTLMAVADDTA